MASLQWLSVGHDGSSFRAQAEEHPGWYWVYRPLNTGPRAYDADQGVILPVYVHADGTVQSPLTDLRDLSADSLVPTDEDAGLRYLTFYAGPLAPGEQTASLEHVPGSHTKGSVPLADGWYWVRTEAPLLHVDADGIGPIYKVHADGGAMVYPAAFGTGRPCDVFELGFAEPLVSEGGIIDASGTIKRHRIAFFGMIDAPDALPGRFPVSKPA
ncbi:MAG: hypothetical protein H6742_08680 [Alphaproteobacteria bacterium]|nr:hypothetical protein [Alphaproteobacteria bacterium]